MLVAKFSVRKRFQNNPIEIFITRKENPFGLNTVNSKRAEPLDKDGEIIFRSARIDYGVDYNNQVMEQLKGLSNLSFKDKRRKKKWSIKILEIGQSPFNEKGGKPEKPFMGKCKRKITWLPKKSSANTLSQTNWSSIQSNLTRRLK